MLTFQAGSIESFEPNGKLHAILALHACDTATDDAIALGLRHGAELIAVAPCCQAELARAWAELATSRTGPMQPLWSTPHLRREAAAVITDTMRALLLRAAGYETRVVEFVPSQHTPKNTLIRAMRRGGPDEAAVAQYFGLLDATGGAGISLARAMGVVQPADAPSGRATTDLCATTSWSRDAKTRGEQARDWERQEPEGFTEPAGRVPSPPGAGLRRASRSSRGVRVGGTRARFAGARVRGCVAS
jgi:hypothetical protein